MDVRNLTSEQEKAQIVALVRAAQAGDRQAFGELVARYETAVYGTAMGRLGNHTEAEELCQEVFLQAMQKLHQLKAPEAFGAWLRAITVRMAINRIVRRAPTVATEPETLEATCSGGTTPLEEALSNEQRMQVHAGLGRLGRLDRETLTAFYVKGRSIVEMSDEFDSPVGTIKRRLHVARKRLAEELESLAV